MYKSKIIQWGQNSQAIGLPRQLMNELGLEKGKELALSVSTKGNIVITNLDGSPLITNKEMIEEE